MSETGVAIKVLGDTQPVRRWEVTGELRRRPIRAFPEENVRVPYPPHVGVTGPMSCGRRESLVPYWMGF